MLSIAIHRMAKKNVRITFANGGVRISSSCNRHDAPAEVHTTRLVLPKGRLAVIEVADFAVEVGEGVLAMAKLALQAVE